VAPLLLQDSQVASERRRRHRGGARYLVQARKEVLRHSLVANALHQVDIAAELSALFSSLSSSRFVQTGEWCVGRL